MKIKSAVVAIAVVMFACAGVMVSHSKSSHAPASTAGASCGADVATANSCGGTGDAPVAATATHLSPVRAAVTPVAGSKVIGTIPARATLKQEAMEDPHTTPPSLIRFSVDLGRRVRASLGTEATARNAFRELKNCASGGDVLQIQTLCLSQAKIVKDKFGSLGGDYDDLLKQVSPKVRNLAQLIE